MNKSNYFDCQARDSKKYSTLQTIFALIVLLTVSIAQGEVLSRQVSSDTKSTRVALIIGNSFYRDVAKLPNPVNDASDLAHALEAKGFNVLLREDTTEKGLKEAVEQFAKYLKNGGIGVFYFAGHGVSLNGQNYLLPVDLSFKNSDDIFLKAVSAEYVLGLMSKAGNRVNIVILDACRNNPFDSGNVEKKGLAVMSLGNQAGTFIAYATSPGSTASDGEGRNGLYTQNLLKALNSKNSEIDKVFNQVRTGVVKTSNGDQVPWTTSSIVGNFYFDINEDEAAIQAEKLKDKEVIKAEVINVEKQAYDPSVAKAHWAKIRSSNKPEDYKEFLDKYGDSPNASFARFRLEHLEKKVTEITIDVQSAKKDFSFSRKNIPGVELVPNDENSKVVSSAVSQSNKTDTRADKIQSATQSQIPVASVGTSLANTEISSTGNDMTKSFIRDCPYCPELIVIPAGEFIMGSNRGEEEYDPDETPKHKVNFTQALAVGKFEITRSQFSVFIQASGYQPKTNGCYSNKGGFFRRDRTANWKNPGFNQSGSEPVVCVSWEDAQAYVAWLWKITNKQYRLLSESEWEYVARAGETKFVLPQTTAGCKLLNIADISSRRVIPGVFHSVCDDGYSFTAPVGKFQPNQFGLHDMLGNAWEWVEDCWNEGYYGAPVDGSSWTSGRCGLRVFRGGGWNSSPKMMRFNYRDRDEINERHDNLGFRVARPLS